jgi:hypothetical protein
MRLSSTLILALLAAAPAAADGPAGSYRVTVDTGEAPFTALLAFSQQNNRWTGQFLGSLDPRQELAPAVNDVRVAGDRLRFSLALSRNQVVTFDGKIPAGRGPIPGSLTAGDSVIPVTLEPSALTKFDRIGLLKEIVTTAPAGSLFYGAVVDLLALATEAKAAPADVKAWADRAAKAAETNGVRWQMFVLQRMALALADQPAFGTVALDLARRAEQLLDPTDEVGVQLAVLDLLLRLLNQAKDSTAAANVQTRIEALEARDYRDYLAASPLNPELFAGRKVRSDRAVLAELFTATEDPPSVAAVLAFDALGRAYKTSEVIRLQYHLFQSGPDPLANKAAEARWAYYQTRLGATAGVPTAIFNGVPNAAGGGPVTVAAIKLKQFRLLIDPLLNTPAGAALQVLAKRDGDKLNITAKVGALAKPSDKIRLRIAIAESVVRYQGRNGLRYHECIVRGFAGSPDGFPMPKPTAEQQATVDLAALRTGLMKELEDMQKKNEDAMFTDPPFRLRSLLVVAFIQDDVTHEVLQTAQVDVR